MISPREGVKSGRKRAKSGYSSLSDIYSAAAAVTSLSRTSLILIALCALVISQPFSALGAVVTKGSHTNNYLGNDDDSVYSQNFGETPSSASWVTPKTNEKWRRTGLRFLTKVKWDTDESDYQEAKETLGSDISGIAAHDFHIVEVETGTKNGGENGAPETLRIHLMRKSSVAHPNLKVVVQDGDKRETWNPQRNNNNKNGSSSSATNCHYVGQVTTALPKLGSNDGEDETVSKSLGGIALLSACTPSSGFSGLIILEDGRQWYVEPAEEFTSGAKRSKREARSGQGHSHDTMEHVLLSHSDLSGHMAAHISDVLRVPLPQLEEAARLAAVDAEARRSMRHVTALARSSQSDWDDNVSSLESLQGESSILTPFFYSGAMLPFIGRGDRSKATQAKKLAAKKTPSAAQTTLLTPLETTTTSSASKSPSGKAVETTSVSSASIENHSAPPQKQSRVVEIAVFTDEELYDKMKSKFKVDTTDQLKEYATAMVNMMDVMYQHSSLGVDLRFRLVYVEVMKRRPSSLKTNGGRAKAYLSSFCDYAGEKNVNSAQWDHALLLTGVDLHEEGVKTTAGLAWAGTMCFRYYSCSISEGLNFASAYITTHEIGHSLGMEHDGVGISETCDSTKYIMSPTTGPGKVTWSSCSSSNLQDFIKYGTSELRGKAKSFNMISRPICLEELVSSKSKSFLEEDSEEVESDLKLPGEKYDANFQCSLGMGSFFKPHFERHKAPFDNICWILYCGNGTHAISTHPALEGTPCDRKKYCRAGQCVKRPETTKL